jgi:Glycosyl transferase family 2
VKPLVSAIIPTRDRALCLPRALDSAYAQEGLGERFDLEVIVVDDASSDGTPDVVRRYPLLRYVRLPERRGAPAAYNAGLRASRGSYLAFLDDDDEWLPHKLTVQVPLIEAHPEVGVVYGQSAIRFEGQETLYPDAARAPSGWVFLPMLVSAFCSHHACFLARRDAFDKAGEFDESFASYEDYDMSLRLAFHSRFLFVPGAVDVYNLSPRGLWLSRAAAGVDDASRVIEKALGMLPDTAAYAAVKRVARARVALETASRIEDPIQAWEKVAATLRGDAGLAHAGWAQTNLASVAYRRALAAPSPLSAALGLCEEIEAATCAKDSGEQWRLRQLLARIRTDVARSLSPAGSSVAKGGVPETP